MKKIFILLITLFLALSISSVLVKALDSDGDGIDDAIDNCPDVYNPDQLKNLGDGSTCDCDAQCFSGNCVNAIYAPWYDTHKGACCPVGQYWMIDHCEICNESDGDEVCDSLDNCWYVVNPDQNDTNNNCPSSPYASDPQCGDACEVTTIPPVVSCGDTITSDTVLTNDLLNCPVNGIVIGANDITLDCRGHTITGTDVYTGILAVSRQNITIKNCTVQNFTRGIRFDSTTQSQLVKNTAYDNLEGFSLEASNNTLTNNTANKNIWGFILSSSPNNTLTSNTAYNNSGLGFSLSSSSSFNTLTNNTASNNNIGIDLYSSSNYNTLTNNTANSNSLYGIRLAYNSNYNTLTNNTANSDNVSGIYLFATSNYNTLISNTANNNDFGFHLHMAHNNTLTSNTANNNTFAGFYLTERFSIGSKNNIFTNNTANNNRHGFFLDLFSYFNTLTSNTANNNDFGFRLFSNFSILTSNTAKNNTNGFSLSSHSTLISNTANNNTNGFLLKFSSNNTLKSNTVSDNSFSGFELSSSSNNTLTSNTAYNDGFSLLFSSNFNTLTSNTAYNDGFSLGLSSNNTLTNNTVNNGTFSLSSSPNNIFTNNTAQNSRSYGFFLSSSSNFNTLTSNTIKNNTNSGIRIMNSSNNLIYNNFFNNPVNAKDDSVNFWNTTKTLGTNIIGGPYLGGNYWHDYTGGDANVDYLGDTLLPYNSNGNIVNGGDFLPLVTLSCGDTITSDTVLTNDLLNCPSDGIVIGANDITLNCQRHTISGTGIGAGILAVSRQNITIKNCTVQNFTRGIRFDSTTQSQLVKNTANNNSYFGISLTFSSNNILTSNTAYNNSFDGFILSSFSNFNTLISNVAKSNNRHGFTLDVSSNNTLKSNGAYDNNRDGFSLSSSNNTLTSNVAERNNNDGFILFSNSNNNLIGNLATDNEFSGLDLVSSSNNTLIGNLVQDNKNHGFRLSQSSSNNTLKSNIAYNNSFDGFFLELFSNFNILTSNTAYKNTNGFFLRFSSNNILTSNKAYDNNNDGFFLKGGIYGVERSNFNSLNNNVADRNQGNGIHLLGPLISNNLTNNTVTLNHGDGIRLEDNANFIELNDNAVCFNSIKDIISDSYGSSGDDNICDNTVGWNDDGTTGCTYRCPSCENGRRDFGFASARLGFQDETGVDCGGACPNQDCCANGYTDFNLNEEGVDCGGSCASCPTCIPLIKKGSPSGKIDLVFIPDHDYGGNINNFLADAQSRINVLAKTSPININKFNFYYMKQAGDADADCGGNKPSAFDDSSCDLADAIAILHTTPFRDCTDGNQFTAGDSNIFLHEAGHAIFGLIDEYCGDTYYNWGPNVWGSEDDCKDKSLYPSSCRKFCDKCRFVSRFPYVNCDWYKGDQGNYDSDTNNCNPDEIMCDNSAPFGADCKSRITKVQSWYVDPPENEIKVIKVYLNIKNNTITELDRRIAYGYSQDHPSIWEDLNVTILSANGSSLENYTIIDPRIQFPNEGSPYPWFEDDKNFTLIFEFHENVRIVEIINQTNDTLIEVDLAEDLIEFCGNISYNDSDCQTLDLDNDGVKDVEDVCPLDPDNDIDKDGVCGDVDDCPFVIGLAQFNGCPNGIKVFAENQTIQSGYPTVKKPLTDLETRVYKKSDLIAAGYVSANWQNYNSIINDPYVTPIVTRFTDASGNVMLGVPSPDDYQVIGVIANSTDKHLGSPVDTSDPLWASQGYVQKYLKQMIIIKPDSSKSLPAKTTRLTGSELLITQPEYMLWDSTEEPYPFVLEGEGDWTVDISLYVPTGYVVNQTTIKEYVSNGVKTVIFNVYKVGSPPPESDVVFNIQHKGKKIKLNDKIGGKFTPKFERKVKEHERAKGLPFVARLL
jgi:parallel beta-helix repeat protein